MIILLISTIVLSQNKDYTTFNIKLYDINKNLIDSINVMESVGVFYENNNKVYITIDEMIKKNDISRSGYINNDNKEFGNLDESTIYRAAVNQVIKNYPIKYIWENKGEVKIGSNPNLPNTPIVYKEGSNTMKESFKQVFAKLKVYAFKITYTWNNKTTIIRVIKVIDDNDWKKYIMTFYNFPKEEIIKQKE